MNLFFPTFILNSPWLRYTILEHSQNITEMNKFMRTASATKETFEKFRSTAYFICAARSTREWNRSQMQSTNVACRSLRFENPSKTFLSLPVSGTERSASVEEGLCGEPRGLARFTLPECRGRVFGRDTKVYAPRIP